MLKQETNLYPAGPAKDFRFRWPGLAATLDFRLALALAGILAAGVILRIASLGFGLPYAYHFDETTYTGAAMNLGAGITNVQINPTGFTNILFVEYGLTFLIGRLTGVYPSTAAFAEDYRTDPSLFLLLGRLTSVFFGTLNILLVYFLGREVRNRWVGLLGALFLSVAFLHIRDSHFAVPDITVTFFTTLAILLCVLAVKTHNLRYLYMGGFATGFGLAVKWSAIPILVPLALAVVWTARENQAGRSSLLPHLLRSKVWLWLAGFTLLGFFLGGFQLLIQLPIYFRYIFFDLKGGNLGSSLTSATPKAPGWIFYARIFRYGLGTPLALLALAGTLVQIVRLAVRREWLTALWLIFPVAYLLAISSTHQYFARYALPVVPLMVLFAADLVFSFAKKLGSIQPLWKWVLVGGLSLLALAPNLSSDLRFNYLLAQTDTRTLAMQWMEANLPPGTKVAIDLPVFGPPLITLDHSVPGTKALFEARDFMDGGGLSFHDLDWYRQNNIDTLITSSFVYQMRPPDTAMNQKMVNFYNELDRNAELVHEFRPYSGREEPTFIFDETFGPLVSLWQRDRPGPTIRIYRLP